MSSTEREREKKKKASRGNNVAWKNGADDAGRCAHGGGAGVFFPDGSSESRCNFLKTAFKHRDCSERKLRRIVANLKLLP